jgi:2-hydroxychromene-2-carboxylate isomerase
VALANEIGLDGENLRERSQQQAMKDLLRANTDEAMSRGAFGSPSIFVPFGQSERIYFGNDQLPLVGWALHQTAL